MNNTINIKRLGLLIRRQWLEFGKIYLISLVVLAGVLAGLYWLNRPVPGSIRSNVTDGFLHLSFRDPVFFVVAILFISITSSAYFSPMGQKSKAITELMIPSSTFEKFLSALFYSAGFSLVTYIAVFYLVDLSFCKYINNQFSELTKAYTLENDGHVFLLKDLRVKTIFSELSFKQYKAFSMLLFATSSVFLLGSVYFNRFQYIKTALFVVLFIALLTGIVYKTIGFLSSGTDGGYGLNLDKEENGFALGILFLTLVLWFITYIRLKEKEV